MFERIKRFFDIVIPRFIYEDVVLLDIDGELHTIKPLICVEDGEFFDGVITLQVFNLFGFALFGKTVGEVRKFTQGGHHV